MLFSNNPNYPASKLIAARQALLGVAPGDVAASGGADAQTSACSVSGQQDAVAQYRRYSTRRIVVAFDRGGCMDGS